MSIKDAKNLCNTLERECNIIHRIIKGNNNTMRIIYVRQLTDVELLTYNVIKPVQSYFSKSDSTSSPPHIMESVIAVDSCKLIYDENKIADSVLSGMCVLLFDGYDSAIEVNLKKVEHKSPDSAELNYSVWGAKDSFTENFDTNLTLIRYRIKDPSLKLETFTIGRRTKTALLMAYIGDIANEEYVKTLRERIGKIDIDGIMQAAKLQWFLNDKKFALFPQAGLEQRSDIACGAMLEGKVVLILDGSSTALILPKLLIEFLWSSDDECDNVYFAVFSKLLRILSVFLSATITSLYIALVAFHAGVLPTTYSMVLASGRAGVPFSVITEVVLMEVLVEILRESLLRVPRSIGSAMGIVGGIVIGQAAVEAGIFSPVILVVVALALMSSYIAPDYNLTNAIRMLKFGFILLTSFFGLFGLVSGIFLVLLTLISDTSLKTPYLSPYAPLKPVDAAKTIFSNRYVSKKRPSFLHTKLKIRKK